MNWVYGFILFISLLTELKLGAEAPSTGTLVVSYQTGLKGERLSRIRFLLRSNKQWQQMYPKKGGCVDDEAHLTRMVIIEGLPAGEYSLEFILPNTDGLLGAVPEHRLKVEPGAIVKIDQAIPVLYGSVQAIAKINDENALLQQKPSIILKDHGNQIFAQSTEGILNAPHLLPGKYTIVFEPIQGFNTPEPQTISLTPNKAVGPVVGIYTRL